jgi:dihydrofolate reductase
MDHLKEVTNGGVVILGRKSYDLAASHLASRNRMVIGVGSQYRHLTTFPSIESALAHAHAYKPEADIWFGGGAQLAAAAFELLEAEGEGLFYETIVHDTYPLADTYMPDYDESKWTEPKVIREYPEALTVHGRQTTSGVWLPVQTPAYTIQVRSVKK